MRLYLHNDETLRSIEGEAPLGYDSPISYIHFQGNDTLRSYNMVPRRTYSLRKQGTEERE